MREIDPPDAKVAQRQAQRVSVAKGRTFRECAVEFIEKNRAGWRNAKHAAQWIACMVMRRISEHAAIRPHFDLPDLLWEVDPALGRRAYPAKSAL